MADLVFNIALGRVAALAGVPGADEALIVIPLEASGLVSDATMRDYDTVAAVLAGASNEQSTMGRKTVGSGITVTVDDSTNAVTVAFPPQTWTGATGDAVGCVVIAYDDDVNTGDDSGLLPLVKIDTPITPDGSDVTVTFPDGIFAANDASE